MKIGILAERMLPGSLPKVTGSEARFLNEFGHETEVLTIMEGGLLKGSYQFNEFLNGVDVRELSREFPAAKKFLFKLPFFSFLSAYHLLGPIYVPHILLEKEYDMILGLNDITCLTAYQIWKKRKIPYIAYLWDPMSYILQKVYKEKLPKTIFYPLLKIVSEIDRVLIENSAITLTLSEAHAETLRKLSHKKKVEVVYVGCNPVEKIPTSRGNYLLAIDRWDRGNTPNFLLEVVSKLHKKANVIVAGFWSETWLIDSFKKRRDELGLEDQVKLIGPVSEQKLKELYLNARAWIHPIEETSVSMPALEAAGCGCPLIMPKSQEVVIFIEGVHGFFPEVGDIEKYVECVDIILEDEKLAFNMGQEAWKVAKAHTWKHHALQLHEIIMRSQ